MNDAKYLIQLDLMYQWRWNLRRLTKLNILTLAIADFAAEVVTMGGFAIAGFAIATNSLVPNLYYAVAFLVLAIPFRYFKTSHEQDCKAD